MPSYKKESYDTMSFFIFLNFLISFISFVNSTELNLDYDSTRLNSTEIKRHKAFIDLDIPALRTLTREVCHDLLLEEEELFFSDNHLDKNINSILKTRHLFPGKADILHDFYQLDSSNIFLPKRKNAFILIVDTIADLSINNFEIYNLLKNALLYKDIEEANNKIINNINNNFIYLETQMNKLIEQIISTEYLLLMICQAEEKFAPTLSFDDLYASILVSSVHRGYEVLGCSSYTYWPEELHSMTERIKFQQLISKNDLVKWFIPLSLQPIKIDPEACTNFGILSNRQGSFIPYISRVHFDNFICDHLGSANLILYSKEEYPSLKYDYNELIKIKKNYKEIIDDQISLKKMNMEKIQYLAEQNIGKAQYELARRNFRDYMTNQATTLLNNLIQPSCFAGYFKRAAMKGILDAKKYMAQLYYLGLGVEKNIYESAKWCYEGSQEGEKVCLYNLGLMYLYGMGVKKDINQAIEFLSYSSAKGFVRAFSSLGKIYLNGCDEVSADLLVAIKYFQMAAIKGCIESQFILGSLHHNGIEGSYKDIRTAVYWYELAAKNKNRNALYRLGLLYYEGLEVEKNVRKGLQLLFSAALLGSPEAQYRFGLFNEEGINEKELKIAPNLKESQEWFQKAANQGYERAIKKLKIYSDASKTTNHEDALPNKRKRAS